MKKSLLILLIALLVIGAAACNSSPSVTKPEQPGTQVAKGGSAASIPDPTAIPAPTEPPENIVLNPWEPTLFTGDQTELKAAGAKAILWYSSDPSVATVDEHGVVTAVGAGTVTITAYSAKDGSVRADAAIAVWDHAASVALNETELTLLTGSEKGDFTLSAQVLPETALIREVSFTSSDTSILSVDANGQLHAVAPGTAIVTVASADEACDAVAECTVTVKQGVSTIELSQTSAEMYLNERVTLTATVYPADAMDKTGVWTSSDESVATVTDRGMVTSKSVGKANIRYTAQDGSEVFGECEVDVVIAPQKIDLGAKNATLLIGASKDLEMVTLSYTVSPDNTSFKNVLWTSSDESVATVDENGTVRGVSAGKATITATTTDPRAANRVKATCMITVGNAVTKIELESGDSRVQKGKTVKINAKLSPEKPFNGKLQWSSSDENILKVDVNGNVRAVNVGTAVITASATDGSNVSATASFTVYQPVTQVKPGTTTRTAVSEGKTVTLTVTVFPDDATDKRIEWSSDAPDIATVDAKGVVTAKKAGECNIIATAADGSGRSAKMVVIVEPKIPIDATTFTRSGYFGMYYEFAVTFKNLTKSRLVKYIKFDLKYTYSGQTYTSSGFYQNNFVLRPNASMQIGWWDQIGYKLTYCSNFRIYLRAVQYADGTWEYFDSDTLIGWFF